MGWYLHEIKDTIQWLIDNPGWYTYLEGLAWDVINGHRLLICGNGWSAADAQHLAAELVVRFEKERKALPAIALTTDSSILTATGNDYNFDRIFSRQVEALGNRWDILVVFSTSGNSKNCIEAIKAAHAKDMKVFGFLWKGWGEIKHLCDSSIVIPSDTTSHIQECHMILYHMLCRMIDLLLIMPLWKLQSSEI